MSQQLVFSVFRKMDFAPDVAVNGQVFTKPHIVDLMLDLAGYSGERSVRLLDPGCGEGAFLVAAAVRLLRSGGIPKTAEEVADCLLGVEKNPEAVAYCKERLVGALVTEGVAPKLASKLSNRWFIEDDFLERDMAPKFNLVVGNPPYVRQEAIPKAKAAGIEPAKGRLTGACLYQHRPHRNESGWQDLNLRSQAPRACAMPGFATPWQCRRGRIRTADLVLPKHAGFQATPRTEMKSAQRESNPHFRHGKAAGYRYIMGASNRWSNCQRSCSGQWLVASGQ